MANFVLLVEDDPHLRDLMTEILGTMGIASQSAWNGFEALELMTIDIPQAIILDIMMPVMDGFQTISHMRTNPTLRNIPIIIMSAIADESMMRKLPSVKSVLRKGNITLDQVRGALREVGVLAA
jgi:CheY-like chemotaxis protein